MTAQVEAYVVVVLGLLLFIVGVGMTYLLFAIKDIRDSLDDFKYWFIDFRRLYIKALEKAVETKKEDKDKRREEIVNKAAEKCVKIIEESTEQLKKEGLV